MSSICKSSAFEEDFIKLTVASVFTEAGSRQHKGPAQNGGDVDAE